MPEELEFADSFVRHKYEKLGCAAGLMAHHQYYMEKGGDYLRKWIEPAIEISQIKIIFDVMRRPVGFVTWAFLADDAARDFSAGKSMTHLSEWNEGRQLWIIDACVATGYITWLYAFFQSADFADHDAIFWSPRGRSAKVRVYRRQLCRVMPAANASKKLEWPKSTSYA
ncbi:RTX toxin acyltransferase family protein [Paraburkholderia sp. BL6669N2]|uniref:toxin-activating lysine-acyltransferase n=1 Tax=Paraburkholderia sp. BL6669N2 TaxID=1938807 RepID=UPI000E242D7A|nr:toxin-activating lysine-acyltransferase [Paraburkholderia sp. BL6669N2]REG60959.1 RTX toxin acyltransferase family protein [Paraburkholderia sp. BL6669N2]